MAPRLVCPCIFISVEGLLREEGLNESVIAGGNQ